MVKLTVLIPCFNSEKVVRPTLESVKWADEILACDSFSTDGTLNLMKEYGARIIQHEYINSAAQKNWAIPQCKHEWVLIVDTDEVLEPGLKEEIQEVLKNENSAVQAYRISRKNFMYGQWVRFGGVYPDYQTRLFRKGKAQYQTKEVHAHMIVEGEIGTFKHHFLHNGFKDIQDWFLKMTRYTRYEAEEFRKQGKSFSLWKAVLLPPLVFLKRYIFELGLLDGLRGFLLAVLDSFYYFMIYMRLFERRSQQP